MVAVQERPSITQDTIAREDEECTSDDNIIFKSMRGLLRPDESGLASKI